MYALCGVARCGATRCGYVSGKVFVKIGGVHLGFGRADAGAGVRIPSLTITDELDEAPNTCTFRVQGSVPARGAEIVITLGTKNSYTRQFAGHALSVTQGYGLRPANLYGDVHAVDYTWLLGAVKVTAQYTNESASTIVGDLIARYGAGNGFTAAAVQAGLPVLDQITFTNEDLTAALTRTARRLGAYWYVDYFKTIHFFTNETRNGEPRALTPDHPSLDDVRCERIGTQALTRVYVEGRGSVLLSHVNIGDTMIPLETVVAFTAAPDVFLKVAFQGSAGGAQHLNFSGVVLTTGGSLVGPGIAPPGAPAAALASGTGLSGAYQYAYTFTTAAGETLPSPLAAITVGALLPPPAAAPFVAVLLSAGALTPGTHQWSYTFTSADGGETTPAPATAATSTAVPLDPNTGGSNGIGSLQLWPGGTLPMGLYYGYVVTYTGTAGGETTRCIYGGSMRTDAMIGNLIRVTVGTHGSAAPIPAGVAAVNIYRSHGSADGSSVNGPFLRVGTVPIAAGQTSCQFDDTVLDQNRGPAVPTVNTALGYGGVAQVKFAIGGPGITGRKVYRTPAGGGALKLLATIANNTDGEVYDGQPDSVLGAAAPTSNTAGAGLRAVQLTNIAIGGAGVTGRKVYRTAAGGGPLKLLAAIADNTTTTRLDQTVDASLGATAPASDTSGLQQPTGQVGAGATAIPVANPGVFQAGGGWAVIGNGEQIVRYTGKTGSAITGIPATGIGAIVAAVVYNSTITTAPMLTGIPASGDRSISGRALVAGDEVYTVVQVDDPTDQAALGALVGGAGIREEWIQDRRLGLAEARARGAATLAVRPLEAATLTYTSRDTRTAAGKVVDVSLPAPTNLFGAFRIQSVTIGNFRPHADQYPTYSVSASSAHFNFEDWLRRLVVRE